MFNPPRRGSRQGGLPRIDAHSNPQHSLQRHRLRGTWAKSSAFTISIRQMRGCHAFISEPKVNSPAQAVPRRNHLCGRGTRRRTRRSSGVFALCCPPGRPTYQSDGGFHGQVRESRIFPGAPAPGVRLHWNPRQQGEDRRQPRKENYRPTRNPPPGPPLVPRRRAKPPSPSPSITRRRTPAALAVGVPLFRGTARIRLFPADNQIVAMDHLGPA